METSPAKHRIEWIDAMRGFTMIMVVANHVQILSFSQAFSWSSSMPLLILFRMPLFFFISGFLAYKASTVWSFSNFAGMMGKKIRIQIVPTAVFFCVALILFHPTAMDENCIKWLQSPVKGGYWFTIALLYMFIIYYIFEFIEHKFRRMSFLPICVLWIVSLLVYESCYLPKFFEWADGRKVAYTGWLTDTSFIQVMKYFHFFIYGNIVHRYWDRVERLYDRKGFILAIIIIAALSSMEFLKLHWLHQQWACISKTLASYSLLTIVFLFFRYYQDSFTKQRRLGRCLQYIGTRTLDVYLIHYLFLPTLPMVGVFFNAHRHNFVIELSAALIVAALVIGMCLLTSNILRISPFLKKYMFGR
ncbi:MAG: acyltransferase [Prevotellaceae bacterium]|nr:acyltransferase [Prevotellaceae bacterium]